MRNVIFSTIMITGLGFGLEDTGLGLGLEENWPWPRRLLALASKMLSSNPYLDHTTCSILNHHHHHVACPMVDVAVPTSLLHACRF